MSQALSLRLYLTIQTVELVGLFLDELVLHADLTCIVLVSDVEHEFTVAHSAHLTSKLGSGSFWSGQKVSLFVETSRASPLSTELTVLRMLLRTHILIAAIAVSPRDSIPLGCGKCEYLIFDIENELAAFAHVYHVRLILHLLKHGGSR